jgi:hypothetical protein
MVDTFLREEGLDVEYKLHIKGLDAEDLVAFANSEQCTFTAIKNSGKLSIKGFLFEVHEDKLTHELACELTYAFLLLYQDFMTILCRIGIPIFKFMSTDNTCFPIKKSCQFGWSF